jgi:hypothetical protein
MAALKEFEATEANLLKLERLWDEIQELIPQGIVFGEDPRYGERCRAFDEILAALPMIDGWKPSISLPDLNGIAQDRFDAKDLSIPEAEIAVETSISANRTSDSTRGRGGPNFIAIFGGIVCLGPRSD